VTGRTRHRRPDRHLRRASCPMSRNWYDAKGRVFSLSQRRGWPLFSLALGVRSSSSGDGPWEQGGRRERTSGGGRSRDSSGVRRR
jgi:hypothetical protein